MSRSPVLPPENGEMKRKSLTRSRSSKEAIGGNCALIHGMIRPQMPLSRVSNPLET
jgi:hypothetical protein